MKVPALLKNKYVCYALMALAALNIIGYVTVKAWECLALFSLAGYSAHCYCKNVSLAILAALFVANFVFGCGRVKEGFEDALAGPAEKATEAASLLQEAADQCKDKSKNDCTGDCDWNDSESKCEQAAAFAASASTCCENNALKTDLGSNQQACTDWQADAANAPHCGTATTTTGGSK
tara:strand:+ start:2348 stop:2881 length:534 start_codon:yes stop_codon:yes gene_type:complete